MCHILVLPCWTDRRTDPMASANAGASGAASAAESSTVTIGVLALQGAFMEHRNSCASSLPLYEGARALLTRHARTVLERVGGVRVVEIRSVADLDDGRGLDGLVIPGAPQERPTERYEEGSPISLTGAHLRQAERAPPWHSSPSGTGCWTRCGALRARPSCRFGCVPVNFVRQLLTQRGAGRLYSQGTCAGLIFLAEQASGCKAGGQQLLGGLHVAVDRNHFGAQNEVRAGNRDDGRCWTLTLAPPQSRLSDLCRFR
jgi:glutamine amidotransferase PdxT